MFLSLEQAYMLLFSSNSLLLLVQFTHPKLYCSNKFFNIHSYIQNVIVINNF